MGEEYLKKQTGEANRPNDPEKALEGFIGEVKGFKNKLDDFDARCKFTPKTIADLIKELEDIKKDIDEFRETLHGTDKKPFNSLVKGIRYALPKLDDARKIRTRKEEMTDACHVPIIRAIELLEGAMEKSG